MYTLFLSALLLSQPTPSDDIGRGLLLHMDSQCETVRESALTIKDVAWQEDRKGYFWVNRPIGKCWPSVRPFQSIAEALELARVEDKPLGTVEERGLGSQLLDPPSPEGQAIFEAYTTIPFPVPVPKGKMPAYSAKTIRTIFNRVYRKPSASIGGVSAQLVYDVVMKDRVHDEVELWLKVLRATTSQRRKALGRAYAQAAKQPGFEPYTYLAGVAEQLLGKDAPLDGYRVVGTVLRRSLDGTLGTVVTLFVQVLDDYDPEFAKQVRKPLLTARGS